MIVEIIGIVATLFILAGFCFKLPAYATAVLNGALILVNGYYLFALIIKKDKNN